MARNRIRLTRLFLLLKKLIEASNILGVSSAGVLTPLILSSGGGDD